MVIDSTMQFRKNLSRADIDAKLPELRAFAEAAELDEIVELLTDTAKLSTTELAERMTRCQEITGRNDEYALLYDQLDMLIFNCAILDRAAEEPPRE